MRTPQRRCRASGSTGSFGGGTGKRFRGGGRLRRKLSPRWRRRLRPWCGRFGRSSRLELRARSRRQVRRGGKAGGRAGGHGRGHERRGRRCSPRALPDGRGAGRREPLRSPGSPGSESRGLRGHPDDFLSKVTPRQVHERLEDPPAGRPQGRAAHARASRHRRGEPRRSGFRFFVTPLSPVFVPNLASCQLDFLSTSNV